MRGLPDILVSVILQSYLIFVASVEGKDECGGVLFSSSDGDVFTSPGYPEGYPSNVVCTWTIKAPEGEKVVLSFADFDVAGSTDCEGDFILLDSVDSSPGPFCGTDVPPVNITSIESTINVTFTSNSQGTCRGFNASFVIVEETFSCGYRTSARQFTFVSPSYPESLSDGPLQCHLEVDHECQEICQIRLDFDEFQLQPPFWGDCNHDRFYVESSVPLPTLCGSNNGTHMYINTEGRSKTDLSFILSQLESHFYQCHDMYNAIEDEELLSRINNGLSFLRRTNRQVDFTSFLYPSDISSTTTAFISSPDENSTPNEPVSDEPLTVALYYYNETEIIEFSSRRAWKIKVTQIPCDCPDTRVSKAPEGCLQYYQGMTGSLKSFNFDGFSCYTEDRWCDLTSMGHVSDCDIRVGFTGHLNNLDYGICIEPESGFCGIQYQQVDQNAFSLTNISEIAQNSLLPAVSVGDEECISDYVWIPGATSKGTFERYCGTQFGDARKWGTVTSFTKPFIVRVISDSDEFTISQDYMNRGFQLFYSQIPCKING